MSKEWNLISNEGDAEPFYDRVVAYQTNNLHFGIKNLGKPDGPTAWSPQSKDEQNRTFFGFVRSGRWPEGHITNMPDSFDSLTLVIEPGASHSTHALVEENLKCRKTFTSDGNEPFLKLRLATAGEITKIIGAVRDKSAVIEYSDPEFKRSLALG